MIYDQDSYLQRSFKTGWHDLINFLFYEFSSGETNEGYNTLRKVGRQLGELHKIENSSTLAQLEKNINSALEIFNWGFIKMAPANSELLIIHCAWPHAPQSVNKKWRKASASVLEGLYTQWLASQGGNESVPVLWNENATEDVFIFRYALFK
ncbi:cellulose synthase [Providencia stuartii]|uniref:Cellulose synthase n=2 Tax=Providencia TaxID=586 RepID=A0A1S1HTJ0_PROST|nr:MULTISPECIES: cellulose biosynthesis protein BcsD [Providencia]ELR5040678.1 cellulose synthase [Providencia stuartii]ELR5081678.1 cellulose synthase [Providencia stuartii]ELR5300387.1 cellulose synthase [Providencia stuartii]MDW7589627.1 cellulose biosynthesis protein BcsD [Providencia sp. 2023EL-00965]MDX4945529.1 cellulose biosynthesis protein BcsD [Providencia manganoxydans]